VSLPFNPASIKKYSAIKIRHYFADHSYHEYKRFVVLGHRDEYLICIKATTQVELYKNNREKMAGCVYYCAKELQFFEKDTAVEPDNQFAIPYSEIIQAYKDGEFHILGEMPDTFEVDLLNAIEDSGTLSQVESARLKSLIEAPD